MPDTATPPSFSEGTEGNAAVATGGLSGPKAGPGWFESSWELVNGLEVIEDTPAESGSGIWQS
jgi:hypothetical protein